MTEQERRALFFKVTGQVYALTSMGIYNAFCKGLEAGYEAGRKDENEAATELRRLHELNAELVEALTDLVNEIGDGFMPHKLFVDQALAALTKAQGETALQRLNKAPTNNGRYLTGYKAQPEPEPVAWMYNGNLHEFDPSDWAVNEVTPLYAAPPQREWQGLTDKEQLKIMKQFGPGQRGLFADAIEAKLKEKNA